MSKKIFAGNWKSVVSSVEEAKKLLDFYKKAAGSYEVIVFPSFTHLHLCEGLKFGAQDCSAFDSGAYTGDVPLPQIKDLGAEYVIIGHSERRKYHLEEKTFLESKVKRVQETGLMTIFCVGESLEEYENGKTIEVLEAQLLGISKNIIIAYEPVWAIGTGKTPTDKEIEEVISHLKKSYKTVLYGGSVSSKNIDSISQNTSADGFLVGGASTKIEELAKIL